MTDLPDRIPVVSAFVFSGDRIALAKRSSSVGTYQGRWAAFSGYVERLAIEQAYMEVQEEASLSDDMIRLRGVGIPLEIDDAEIGKRWLVSPFLFQMRGNAQICTDAEAEDWGWFSRDEVRKLRTVPGLDAALARVWPPFATARFWEELAAIGTDTEHGATSLARRGLEALCQFAHEQWEELTHDEVVRAIRAFAAARPAMGAFPDLAARLLLSMQRDAGQFDLDVLIADLLNAVDDATILSSDVASEGIADAQSVFTLSYGQAVRDTLLKWNAPGRRVIVAESHPGAEGITLARELEEQGLEVETVADADIEAAVAEVDAVLVGSDAITSTGELQNKVGTHAAVLAARERGIPAYGVTQTFKITPPGWPTFVEVREGAEPRKPRPVFDLTPLEWFKAVFTEIGTLSTTELETIRAELGSVELIPTKSS